MCASDEFEFLPRAESASLYYDQLENLDSEHIQNVITRLKDILGELRRLKDGSLTAEDRIDVELLESNICGVLIEFEHTRSWKHNPLLYLKIAFIGLDHACSKPCMDEKELVDRCKGRLSEIPELLNRGVRNLEKIPESYHRAALAMVNDSMEYLSEVARHPVLAGTKDMTEYLDKAKNALVAFGRFLSSSGFIPNSSTGASILEMRVKNHFAVKRSLAEIYEISREEWQEILLKLGKLSKDIDSGKTWQELYVTYNPIGTNVDTHTLYRDEITRLREHVRSDRCLGRFPDRVLELAETPTYLRSVRSSASFSAPFSPDVREKAYFYITSARFDGNEPVHGNILKRLHREYRFLTAHETYPGHHLLDVFRRNIQNTVRRQIESPLFYEGWAYYAESIPIETGYIEDPIEVLVDLKRQLWRSARCQIDVGLGTGKLSRSEAVELLRSASFTSEEAEAQVSRFGLNPGYQLCYALGRYEIRQLRKRYGSLLGFKEFHRLLLEGGELPFYLADLNLRHQVERAPGTYLPESSI